MYCCCNEWGAVGRQCSTARALRNQSRAPGVHLRELCHVARVVGWGWDGNVHWQARMEIIGFLKVFCALLLGWGGLCVLCGVGYFYVFLGSSDGVQLMFLSL